MSTFPLSMRVYIWHEVETVSSELRAEICLVGQRLHSRNLLAAADGNISVRLPSGEILITPSGRQKGFLEPSDLTIITLDGEVRSKGKPSGESSMHLEIYRRCEKARAVIHAHPPYAVALTLARPQWRSLPNENLSEVILAMGEVPIVPYARPVSADMGEKLIPFLPSARAMILKGHGAVCWGEDLTEALNGMERVEHSSQILFLAETLGGSEKMPAGEVEVLKKMRRNFGERLL